MFTLQLSAATRASAAPAPELCAVQRQGFVGFLACITVSAPQHEKLASPGRREVILGFPKQRFSLNTSSDSSGSYNREECCVEIN